MNNGYVVIIQVEMKLTVCFGQVKVIVPCGDGVLTVKELIAKATARYVKASLQVCFYHYLYII